jgi:hypothetical protein
MNHYKRSFKRGVIGFFSMALPVLVSNLGNFNWNGWQDMTIGAFIIMIAHFIEKKYLI